MSIDESTAPRRALDDDSPITRLPGVEITGLGTPASTFRHDGRTRQVDTATMLLWMRGYDGELKADDPAAERWHRRAQRRANDLRVASGWAGLLVVVVGLGGASTALCAVVDAAQHHAGDLAMHAACAAVMLAVTAVVAAIGFACHHDRRATERQLEAVDAREKSLRKAWDDTTELSPEVSRLATARLGAWREGLGTDPVDALHEVRTAQSVVEDAQLVLDDPGATTGHRERARESLRVVAVAAERAEESLRTHREHHHEIERAVAAERERVLEGFARSDRDTERMQVLARLEQGTQQLLGTHHDTLEEER